MINKTINHHFISQAEQRLNAIDPTIPKEKQRIYSFSITDREEFSISLKSPNGAKIRKTLSLKDLYTIDEIDSELRINLENLFCQYEQLATTRTKSFLQKIDSNNPDLKSEVLDIFALKLINTFRNPFCIEKTLKTIGFLADLSPKDEALARHFEKIDSGKNPSIQKISNRFSVSEIQYKNWIKSIFMLLSPQNPSLLEIFIKEFFERKDQLIYIHVHTYSDPNKSPLLSDRGFTLLQDDDGRLCYEFNLPSSAFIVYSFIEIKKAAVDLSNETLEKILDFQSKQIPKIYINKSKDQLDFLSQFNKRVVYHSHKNVYCKNKIVHGL